MVGHCAHAHERENLLPITLLIDFRQPITCEVALRFRFRSKWNVRLVWLRKHLLKGVLAGSHRKRNSILYRELDAVQGTGLGWPQQKSGQIVSEAKDGAASVFFQDRFFCRRASSRRQAEKFHVGRARLICLAEQLFETFTCKRRRLGPARVQLASQSNTSWRYGKNGGEGRAFKKKKKNHVNCHTP